MKHISSLLKDFEAVCERVTGKTVAEWQDEKRDKTVQALETRKIRLGELYTERQMVALHRWGLFPFDAFKAVTINADDPLVTLTEDEWKARDAWNSKKGTIMVERHGRQESRQIHGPITTVTRYRLIKLEEHPVTG